MAAMKAMVKLASVCPLSSLQSYSTLSLLSQRGAPGTRGQLHSQLELHCQRSSLREDPQRNAVDWHTLAGGVALATR